MNLIVAPCFTTVPCPQRHKKVKVGPELINDWANSLKACGLKGAVIYDQLPTDLISAYPHVEFVQFPPPPAPLAINDYRFFAYRQWLREADCGAAFFTDLFDMVVQHDPFPWLLEQNCMVFGDEGDRIGQSRWMRKKLDDAYGETWNTTLSPAKNRCTAGLFGGLAADLIPFLDIVCGIISTIHHEKPKFNANMAAFQVAVHCGLLARKKHFGPPLHHPRWRFGQRDEKAFFHHVWRGLKSPLFE